MDHSVTFAQQFARLVRLLLREPANIDDQKSTLRAIVATSREGEVKLHAALNELSANGTPVDHTVPGLEDLLDCMREKRVRSVEADAGAAPADLLTAARHLASPEDTEPGAAIGPTVRFEIWENFVTRDSISLIPEFEMNPPEDETPVVNREKRSTPRPGPMSTDPDAVPLGRRHGIFEHIKAVRAPTATVRELLDKLETATRAGVITRVLDDLATIAEESARSGKLPVASEILHRIVRGEQRHEDANIRLAFLHAIRRLTKPQLLRAVAEELVRFPEKRAEHLEVLARTGEDGADALIDRLVAAAGRSDRRVYFDALLELRAGVPTLVHMLGDHRWFVARNAAALLGELGAREAEQPLIELLRHDDERVRHAATIALMRLGAVLSVSTIELALRDGAPQVRMQVAGALSDRERFTDAALLIRALDAEDDDDVKQAFISALGRLASPDAVARLVSEAQPERGLFRKKGVELRVAAVQALAEARTDAALSALRELRDDREPAVRTAAIAACVSARS